MSALKPALDRTLLEETVRRALAEDLGVAGDITSILIVRIDQPGRARIIAKSPGLLAGTAVADAVFRLLDKAVKIEWALADGASLSPGDEVATLSGRARALLAGERVALNFLSHLCGVATLTEAFVAATAPHGVRLLCTRKTIPGLRGLQRYAVVVGGGHLHRAGLFDEVLVKNNHEKLAGGVAEALARVLVDPSADPEVEVRDLDQLMIALDAGCKRILLDNADLPTIKEAVRLTRGKAFLEISGGVTLKNVSAIAKLKPDAISSGAITHSAAAVDLAMHVLGPASGRP